MSLCDERTIINRPSYGTPDERLMGLQTQRTFYTVCVILCATSNVFRVNTERDGRAYRQVWSSTANQRLRLTFRHRASSI